MGNGSGRTSGTVKFFNPDKGYGFIRRDGGQDVFVHANELRKSGILDLAPIVTGAKLEFTIESREKGPTAIDIKVVPGEPQSTAVA
jgi:CspA family cold shock protein